MTVFVISYWNPCFWLVISRFVTDFCQLSLKKGFVKPYLSPPSLHCPTCTPPPACSAWTTCPSLSASGWPSGRPAGSVRRPGASWTRGRCSRGQTGPRGRGRGSFAGKCGAGCRWWRRGWILSLEVGLLSWTARQKKGIHLIRAANLVRPKKGTMMS